MGESNSIIDVQNTEQLHAHDHHQNVTETSDHRTTQKVQIHGPHRYCEPGYSSVMQSSRDITHGGTMAAHNVLCSSQDTWYTCIRLAWTRWSTFAV